MPLILEIALGVVLGGAILFAAAAYLADRRATQERHAAIDRAWRDV